MEKKAMSLLKRIFKGRVILIFIAFVLLGGNLFLSIVSLKKNDIKIAYVSMPKLYSGFKMKAELETKLKKIETDRERLLEQMQGSVRSASLKSPGDSFLTPAEYQVKANKVVENSKKIADNFTGQIWARLNEYVKDYCSDKNISIMLGADGAGAVMAADPGLDKTEDILAYVNKRYQGINTNGNEKGE